MKTAERIAEIERELAGSDLHRDHLETELAELRERERIERDGYAVDDLATYCIGSDRYAGRIVQASPSGHRVIFQMDHARNVGGPYPNQRWIHAPNTDGRRMIFTRRKDGRYRERGSSCGGLIPGHHHYQDPHF